jgi:hypothetical protein
MADIKVYGTIVPVNKKFPSAPVMESRFLKGGYKSVSTLKDRDRYSDPNDLQIFSEAGMVVYVKDEKQNYQLGDNLITWTEWPPKADEIKLKFDLAENDPAIFLNGDVLIAFEGREGVVMKKKQQENKLVAKLDPEYIIDEGEWI